MSHSTGEYRTRAAFRASRRTGRIIHLSLIFDYSWIGRIAWSRLLGPILFSAVAAAFYFSPVHYLSDSGFSLLMDEAIIHYGTPDMIHYQVPRGHGGIFIHDRYPWNLEVIKGRLLYAYPWGSSLLSLPQVAVFNAYGFKIAPHKDRYKWEYSRENKMQTLIATAICAAAIWLIYEAGLYLLPRSWSLAIALAAAFGTPVWSSASRSLWPQTWALLLMVVAIWIFLSGRTMPFLLGSVAAWSCLVRPQVIPEIAIISCYVLMSYDRQFISRYIVAGLCWAVPVCSITYYFTGGLFSSLYAPAMLDFRDLSWRVYGLLLSPSRGLLVFSPVIVIPLFLIVRYWPSLAGRERRLAILSLSIVGIHLALTASWGAWWGGGCYGPRMLLELVPWLVLLSIIGTGTFLQDGSSSSAARLLTTSMAALALVVSMAANAPGALDEGAITWRSFDPNHLEVLWDWHDPQFLCWLPEFGK